VGHTGNQFEDSLIGKIKSQAAKIGVVGLGYVGLPFAVEAGKCGFLVTGFDRSGEKVDKVNTGENYIGDVNSEALQALVTRGLLRATADMSLLGEMDVIVVAVPTPLNKNLNPDLGYVEGATREIANYLHKGQLISLESTTYPGTTDEVMKPILEASGLKVGVDFYLAHSPERVDPGNARFNTKNTTKVVGASDPSSLLVASAFYGQIITQVVEVSSAAAAELTKVFENTFRAVNIALVNELTMLCDRLELNVWEVLDAAFTKPFGIMPFYPGPGVGGHCIPLDPHYLEWKAREFNFNTRFISLAGEINRHMPEFVVEKAARILSDIGKGLRGAKVLALGVAYKKDIDDPRESPATEVINLLHARGCVMSYHDPYVSSFSEHGLSMANQDLTAELLRDADLVIVLTDHTKVDYALVVEHAGRVLDTRNVLKRNKLSGANVLLL